MSKDTPIILVHYIKNVPSIGVVKQKIGGVCEPK